MSLNNDLLNKFLDNYSKDNKPPQDSKKDKK